MNRSRNEYIVNHQILNDIFSTEELSNNSIAERLAPILKCSIKSVAVRIGSIRKCETLATDEVFLRELEKILKLKNGTLFGEAITQADLQRMKRLKERRCRDVSLKLNRLITDDGRRKTVEVDKDFLRDILDLL